LHSSKSDQTSKITNIDTEEGPEWIKELNKMVNNVENGEEDFQFRFQAHHMSQKLIIFHLR
jgi:hypothetical protein